MLYVVEIEYNATDHYGFHCRKSGVVHVVADNKSQARRMAREKCIIANMRKPKIGRART